MIEIFDKQSTDLTIENKTIKPWKNYKLSSNVSLGPSQFNLQKTTIWSFPKRGSWASHTPQYRGNWPPEVVRNILLRYSKTGDLILDPMVGGGTTPVECLLLGRNSISVDINRNALAITQDRLDLPTSIMEYIPKTTHRTFLGDTRKLDLIQDNSIDLITAHPPYINIIKYTNGILGDLSEINNYNTFFTEFRKAISEYYRVLKPNSYCAVLMGDTHNKKHYVPATFRMMFDFLREGFVLKEDIIKKEWNCESDHYSNKYSNLDFLLTAHEHLFIFRKPLENEYYPNSSIDFFMT